jgi:lysophospholipid acyltransferase (LPLAT)-like uncharacterized protein
MLELWSAKGPSIVLAPPGTACSALQPRAMFSDKASARPSARLDHGAVTRKSFSDALTLGVLPPLLAGYVGLVRRTTRWRRIGDEHHQALIESGAPFICAFWHSRILMMPVLIPEQGRTMTGLISPHKDGEIVARVMARFGVEGARGSSADPRKPGKKKHGAEALKTMVGRLRSGQNAGVTPDGPRGPPQRGQAGVIQLARLTGAPILPMTYSVSSGHQLDSWDRFLIPFPFSSGIFVFGQPMSVTARGPDALEAARLALEDEWTRITGTADRERGRQAALPAPAAQEVHV